MCMMRRSVFIAAFIGVRIFCGALFLINFRKIERARFLYVYYYKHMFVCLFVCLLETSSYMWGGVFLCLAVSSIGSCSRAVCCSFFVSGSVVVSHKAAALIVIARWHVEPVRAAGMYADAAVG